MSYDEPISLYVPARNAEQHLAACVAALQSQTRRADELFIVVDPRSNDATAGVARGLGVQVVEQTGHTLGAARNQAIRCARHRWLASCDSDVIAEPDWLERLCSGRAQGAAGIGGRTLEHIRSPFDHWRSIQMPHHWGEFPLRNPFMLVSEVLFDRQALLAIGGYRDDLNYYEDSDLCQRLRDAGHELFYEPTAIAHHQRRDTLLSVLDLRWRYSEYRQRHLLDRYDGLVAKLTANREYAVNTLSRLLANGREELTYISFLLYFHHLVKDLQSLHSRRPLLPGDQCRAEVAELQNRVNETLTSHSETLARHVMRDLELLSPQEPGELAAGRFVPNWTTHLDRVQREATRFVTEMTPAVLRIVENSARYVHGQAIAGGVQRLARPSMEQLRRSLQASALQTLPVVELMGTVNHTWPQAQGIELVGRFTAEELDTLRHAAVAGASTGLLLHMESHPSPLALLSEMRGRYGRLVVCYQPPREFIPGLDVVSAADLASAAAAAGWIIDRFDTLIGRTRLMLSAPLKSRCSKKSPSPRRHSPPALPAR